MRKTLTLILAVLLISVSLFGCNQNYAKKEINTNIDLVYPDFQEHKKAEDYEDQVYDVLELDLSYGMIRYTDIGDVIKGEYILTGNKTHLTEYNLYKHVRYTDGVIIYYDISYAFYRDSKGNAFVRCVDERFKPEYGTDKRYIDFINWALDFIPSNDVYKDSTYK